MAGKRFEVEHYLSDSVAQLDSIFYLAHLVMSAIHKRILVTSREQRVFEAALALLTFTLLLKLFYRPIYNRHRTVIVFITHLCLTTCRASVTYSMASKQAVHWRISLTGQLDSRVFLVTILSVLGGPFRAFEMLGLQQQFSLHAIVSLYYLVVHTAAVAPGARLAYSNALFYLVHEVHDGMAAVVDTFLESVVPLPVSEQATCSSCAGVVVYSTLLLYASVVVPLYLAYTVEKAARKRFVKRMAAAAAAARDQDGQLHGESHDPQQEQQQPQKQEQEQLHGPQMPAAEFGQARPGSDGASCIAACAIHVLVLLSTLLMCWLLANAFALLVLPRVLSSKQLAFYCPNRPVAPYRIAGEVYYS